MASSSGLEAARATAGRWQHCPMDAPRTARAMWKLFEPLHAVTYFADECIEEYAAVGLKGFWMGYFAGRAAPMGAVAPAVVDATFFSFNPDRVQAGPSRRVVLRRPRPGARGPSGRGRPRPAPDPRPRRNGDAAIGADDLARAAALARAAVEGLTDRRATPGGSQRSRWRGPTSPTWPCGRRPRCCASTAATGTSWRSVAAGLDGRQALVTMAATGAVPKAMLQAARGWDDDAWDESAARADRTGLGARGRHPDDVGSNRSVRRSRT